MPSLQDYALIGNCETAALISPEASIDWLCWPNFDSHSCFGALGGRPDHGFWRIVPQESGARFERRYRGPTPILETEIETATGRARVIDFMPTKIRDSHVVRRVEGLAGEIALKSEFCIRFGDARPFVRRHGDNSLHFIAGPDRATLRTPLVHEAHGAAHGETYRGTFTLLAGETLDFSLTYTPSYADSPRLLDPAIVLDQTERTWRAWTGRCTYEGPYRDTVIRALITLRASIFQPAGSIVAAAGPSDQANDMRLCRLEGAYLNTRALLDAGYEIEAKAWRNFLLRAIGGDSAQLQSRYGVTGAPAAGGAAALSLYGDVMIALCESRRRGLNLDPEDWHVECDLLQKIEAMLLGKIERAEAQDAYDRLMALAAFTRGVEAIERFGLSGPRDHWQGLCAELSAAIDAKAFDADPRLLFLTELDLLPDQEKRLDGLLAAIERSAMRDGLICTDGKTVSLAASFAYVEALARVHRLEEAHRLFDRLCGLGNDLGLLAAAYDVENQAAQRRVSGDARPCRPHQCRLCADAGREGVKAWPQMPHGPLGVPRDPWVPRRHRPAETPGR